MARAELAADGADDFYEKLYQPTCINVEGSRWEKFGYGLIACSTVIMIMQAAHVGPPSVWTDADDVTTILFTIELVVRIFEKGYLFFTEPEKNWNFFDSLVVAISLFSMVVTATAKQDAAASGKHGSASSNAAMNKMKVLRTLRLLRLLRLFRVFKGIEKVNHFVDTGLNIVGIIFLVLIIMIAIAFFLSTLAIALTAAGGGWLRTHSLPDLPQIE
mmetsp:Transcript_115177/g.289860  ORF Transcript_115177/g.289860 Transcript_115177/m.289860 type:complete len:216 (-) Transcript_115177:319-966(-)